MLGLILPLALAGVYLVTRGFFLEPTALRLERTQIAVPGLPPKLAGTRLLHLTDLHLRGGVYAKAEEAYHERLYALVGEAAPDVILLTGDYADTKAGRHYLEEVIRQLGQKAPVVAVMGDNDLETAEQTDEIMKSLLAGGARVLRNQAAVFPLQGEMLNLVGVDDPKVGAANLTAALTGVDLSHTTVLLSHSAEIYPEALEAGIELLLSGHTHGGQVRVPLYGAVITNDRLGRTFASGFKQVDSLQIHVGRGVGWAKMPLRLFCPPEITLILLHAAAITEV